MYSTHKQYNIHMRIINSNEVLVPVSASIIVLIISSCHKHWPTVFSVSNAYIAWYKLVY